MDLRQEIWPRFIALQYEKKKKIQPPSRKQQYRYVISDKLVQLWLFLKLKIRRKEKKRLNEIK